ncbi:universal stress protein [Halomonas sp. ATCH28]|uniref:Universal stress protein n=1 Tax=Halomonas gemina TaxID=2945105 RepID=A0ABT0T049_9GAMM|nr:universal stress protein [Halomonas gemina]MCL7940269.1 universal stress protein [Halomonas gemina]
MTRHIIASIDDSDMMPAVCDAAAWASKRIGVPMTLLHVIENMQAAREQEAMKDTALGDKMQALDTRQLDLLRERAELVLEQASQHCADDVSLQPLRRLEEGVLVEVLASLEDEMRLLILGKHGATTPEGHLGGNIVRVIRALHRPILIVQESFRKPRRIMLAFDGSKTTVKGVQMVADSPLLDGVECDVVMVGGETDEHREQMEWVRHTLEGGSIPVRTFLLPRQDTDQALVDYACENDIDMMIMGAYGHSRIRHLLVGSITGSVLLNAPCSLLVLR